MHGISLPVTRMRRLVNLIKVDVQRVVIVMKFPGNIFYRISCLEIGYIEKQSLPNLNSLVYLCHQLHSL
jgi:hypothetical protein